MSKHLVRDELRDEEFEVESLDPEDAAEKFCEETDRLRCDYPPERTVEVMVDGAWTQFHVELEAVPSYIARRRL